MYHVKIKIPQNPEWLGNLRNLEVILRAGDSPF